MLTFEFDLKSVYYEIKANKRKISFGLLKFDYFILNIFQSLLFSIYCLSVIKQ